MTLPLAFLAGFVTVLSPCVLPLLPVLLASTVSGGWLRPWGVLAGFVASFVAVTLLLATFVQMTGVAPDVIRTASGLVLLACGLILAVPALSHRFEMGTGRIVALGARVPDRQGLPGGLLLGASLGLVWTPCVGPIMASVISLALSGEVDGGAVAVATAYAAGTALPMGAVIFGGRALLNRVPLLQRNLGRIRGIFGVLLVLAAVALLTGADRTAQAWLFEQFPNWEHTLTGWEPAQ